MVGNSRMAHHTPHCSLSSLEKIAETIARKTIEGGTDCRQEIGNRLDGKPAQAVDMNVTQHTREETLSSLMASAVPERDGSYKGKIDCRTRSLCARAITTFTLSQAEAAQRLSESRHLRGKLVFEVR
jgi:hypothetical protein